MRNTWIGLQFAVCLCLPLAVCAQTSSSTQFTDYKLTNGGTFPQAAADFTRNGRADIVEMGVLTIPGSSNTTSVEILMSNGNGYFTPKPVSNAGFANDEVLAADLNGDGYPDLVEIATFYSCGDAGCDPANGTLSIQLGNGDGTFRAPVVYFGAAGAPTSAVLADVNGDGKPDLVVTSYNTAETATVMQLLLNNGNGTFSQGSVSAADGTVIAAGDFRRNGRDDLVVNGINGTEILKNNGNNTFTKVATYPVSASATGIAVANVNNDDYPDLILAAATKPYILLGNGDDTFRSTAQDATNALVYRNPVFHGPMGLAAGDFNKDGNLDIAVGPYVYFGKGDGSFSLSKIYSAGGIIDGAQYGSPVLAADVVGNGILDLVLRTNNGQMAVAIGNNNGIFNAPLVMEGSGAIAVGDFNRDGVPDLVAGGLVYLGSGRDYFGPGKAFAKISGAGGLAVVGDVNGDGLLDIVLAGQNPSTDTPISVVFGNGNGTFSSAKNGGVLGLLASGNSGTNAFLVDMNHDGKLDLVGQWGVALGHGDGTFEGAKPLPSSVNDIQNMAVGDVNHDGYPDLAILSGTGVFPDTLTILLGNGDGTFRVKSTSMDVNGYVGVAIADVNKDGIPDLIYSGIAAGTPYPPVVDVQLSNGDGTFKAPMENILPSYAAAPSRAILVADFDGDGTMDIAVPENQGFIAYLHGIGGGKFASPFEYEFAEYQIPGYDDSSNFFGILALTRGHLPSIVGNAPIGIVRLTNTK